MEHDVFKFSWILIGVGKIQPQKHGEIYETHFLCSNGLLCGVHPSDRVPHHPTIEVFVHDDIHYELVSIPWWRWGRPSTSLQVEHEWSRHILDRSMIQKPGVMLHRAFFICAQRIWRVFWLSVPRQTKKGRREVFFNVELADDENVYASEPEWLKRRKPRDTRN